MAALRACLLKGAVAQGTLAGYGAGWHHWERYCSLTNSSPSRLLGIASHDRELALADFAAYCSVLPSQKGGGPLRAATISGYCNAVGKVYQIHYGQDVVKPLDLHRRVLKGVKREEQQAGVVKRRKLPLTKALLIRAEGYFSKLGTVGTFLKAALHLASELLLRISEVIPTKAGHAPRRQDLSISTVWGGDSMLTLHVRSSKCSWEPCDRQLRVGRPLPPFSAALLMQEYLVATRGLPPNGPLFPFWTYAQVLEHIRLLGAFLGFPEDAFGTHSLRRGGAYDLLDEGFAPEMVRVMGRWKSDVWLGVYAELKFSVVHRTAAPVSTAVSRVLELAGVVVGSRL